MLKRTALIAALFALAAPAAAQKIDYEQRARDLERLSGAFGELHHIRRLCEPRREAEVWRNRMRRLVELEQPTATLRDRMVAAFNSGFRNAEARYPYCDGEARDHAAAVAVDADEAVQRLAAPLYEAIAGTEDL